MRPPPTAIISNVQKHVRKNAPSWLESQLTAVLELRKEFHQHLQYEEWRQSIPGVPEDSENRAADADIA